MRARDFMVPVSFKLSPSDTLRDAVRLFRHTRMKGFPVVDENDRFIGMFTRSNLYDCLLNGVDLDSPIEGHFLKEVIFFREDKEFRNLSELKKWLRSARIGQTPVIDLEGRPAGFITQEYMINFLLDHIELLYQELSSIFQQVPHGVIVTDEHGIVNLASSYVYRILPGARVGRPVNSFLPEPKFEEVVDGLWVKPRKVNYNNSTLIVSALPVVNAKAFKGAILTLQDATEIESVFIQFKGQDDGEQKRQPREQLMDSEELYRLNGTKYTFNHIIGKSDVMAELKRRALKAAESASTVLIYGECGTGKELLAQAIHNASDRQRKPFVTVNCAAIPLELAESEFFGYEGGAFTGARRHGKPGKFELADGGTIFLDEVGDMPLPLQGKLLRVIQEREVERVGGLRPREVDVRIIAATNKDLYRLVGEGKFRQDLFFRLKVLFLKVPPLRERVEDIPLLVYHFIDKYNRQLGRRIEGISDEAMEILKRHNWPGNVRELENMIETAVIFCKGRLIQVEDLAFEFAGDEGRKVGNKIALTELERDAIFRALEITGGNKSKAAKLLGISRSTLYEKLNFYGRSS